MAIRRHLKYFKYLMHHKWFVYVAALKLRNAPLDLFWLSIIHDWSKFRLSEWNPYAECFYAPDGSKQYNESRDFTLAWNHHQKRNKHHWQYWIITWDRGITEAIPMHREYIWEMVADWMGAGRAITGRWEVKEWYVKNKDKMILHYETRVQVEEILNDLKLKP